MSVSPTLYSSDSGEWQTPLELFAAANRRWGPFTLDAAASQENTLADEFFALCDLEPCPTPGCLGDAFKADWDGRVWLNPPYGRGIGNWIARAFEEVQLEHAERVVCLVPARTDTRWWQQYVMCADDIIYLAGRVAFKQANGKTGPAPFPSAIVVFEQEFSYNRGSKA